MRHHYEHHHGGHHEHYHGVPSFKKPYDMRRYHHHHPGVPSFKEVTQMTNRSGITSDQRSSGDMNAILRQGKHVEELLQATIMDNNVSNHSVADSDLSRHSAGHHGAHSAGYHVLTTEVQIADVSAATTPRQQYSSSNSMTAESKDGEHTGEFQHAIHLKWMDDKMSKHITAPGNESFVDYKATNPFDEMEPKRVDKTVIL